MLTRGFVQKAAFTFVLGVGFCFAGNSVFERAADAQFRASSPTVSDQLPTAMQPFTPEIPDQHRKTPTITPVEPIAPRVEPISPKLDQTVRNQIVEKHLEQLKSGECSRKLEQRRRALRQQRAGSHGAR